MSKNYVYTGQDNLEVMQEAVNYNRYQYLFVDQEIRKVKSKNKKILDFGAGIGTYADMVKGKGRQVDCVEVDPNGVKVLKQKGYKVYSDISQVKTKYDVIYSLNVLEHLEDDAKTLADLKRCLSSTGVIVIYVPAFMLLFTQLDVKVKHFRRYRIKDLKELGRKTGLRIKTVKYCDPIGFAAALFYRAIHGSGALTPRSVRIFDHYLFPFSVFLEPVTKKTLGKNVLVVYTKK